MPSATSFHPRPQSAERPAADPVALWLAALMRASSELLDNYVVAGRAPREGAPPEAVIVDSGLHGGTRGLLRCRIEGPLAVAVAEGMWGAPAAELRPEQIGDAARELCGQVIGYAAGEVSAQFPGVLFEPPRPGQDGAPLDAQALVPTRVGALRWEVRAEAAPEAAAPQHAVAVRDRIRALRDADLQLLQAVRVLGVDESAEDAFERLLKAVGSDPALSARILRRVNSAMVRPRGSRIQTLPQALLFLGTRSAKNIVISALMAHSVTAVQPSRRRVVLHSLQVAILTRQLGLGAGLDGDECYLLGLLHDLGRLVLDRLYPDEAAALEGLEERALLEQEIQHMGITHAEAGAMVASAWRFPDAVRLAMTAHHDEAVLEALGLPDDQVRQVQLVSAADRLAERWERGGFSDAERACDELAPLTRRDPAQVREALSRAAQLYKEELLGDSV